MIILFLLIAYARCVADQFGMLHTTEASCCQVVCQENHCSDIETEQPDEHSSEQDEETPSPCQLCMIISTDGATFDAGIKVPSPQVLDLKALTAFAVLFDSELRLRSTEELPSLTDHDRPPEAQLSEWLCVVSKAMPVRGPSTP